MTLRDKVRESHQYQASMGVGLENSAGCSCGLKFDWYDRHRAYSDHFFAAYEDAVIGTVALAGITKEDGVAPDFYVIEQVARIIDPKNWELTDSKLHMFPVGHPACDQLRADSMEKAMKILSLLVVLGTES